jgi:hypothetical protein
MPEGPAVQAVPGFQLQGGGHVVSLPPAGMVAAGLAVLGWRLAASRRRRRRLAGAGVRGRLSQERADDQPVPPRAGPAGPGCARWLFTNRDISALIQQRRDDLTNSLAVDAVSTYNTGKPCS